MRSEHRAGAAGNERRVCDRTPARSRSAQTVPMDDGGNDILGRVPGDRIVAALNRCPGPEIALVDRHVVELDAGWAGRV
jgi:hypothetical protein